jgi:hypothetical protein
MSETLTAEELMLEIQAVIYRLQENLRDMYGFGLPEVVKNIISDYLDRFNFCDIVYE